MRSSCKIVVVVIGLLVSSLHVLVEAQLTLPHQHPNPEAVVQEVRRRVNESISRRQLLGLQEKDQCGTGNPIDDCWHCNPNWRNDPQILADCAIGFGHDALGGKGGRIYYVTDPSDNDPVNPAPGTLRYGVIQSEPLWILFSGNMVINLKYELLVSSFKTIDGRGPRVEITGKGCVILDSVSNVIIHNIHIHHCKPSGNAKIRTSPVQISERGQSDGDGISVYASSKIWIDHCSLSYCTDGLIDVTRGSTAVTISNSFFSHHEKVMLLGHSDDFTADSGMQVTVAFNHFGEDLVERMPRCRHGYFHVVNNDYTQWGMYAVGGSAAPIINSQGNRYIAPQNGNNKEVTKRMDTDESEWRRWNWRSEGDLMVNGAFFVPSGVELSPQFTEATSMAPFAANVIEQLTMNVGVTGLPSNVNPGNGMPSNPGGTSPGETPPSPGLVVGGTPPVTGYSPPIMGYGGGGTYGYYPWGNGGNYGPRTSNAPKSTSIVLIILVVSTLYSAFILL
ncbi:probable pectate lyase 5 isoform X2 [Punica granatum]|uniref:Pectate lyase n=1 Tax=Punica granatum TaxID=22663 RepID=A0A6P8BY99_PUNGR|nr:probable pectate lyase 5 isoform X2 [Punica granatum]